MAIPFRPSSLDGNQVLQHAFDEDTCELRVKASVSSGGNEVIIDHADDSIRLGDGTTLFTGTTIGSKTGLDINVLNDSNGITPDVDNVSMPSAGTEYSYNLVANTKKITIRSRLSAKLQIAWSLGDTGTTFLTVKPGNSYTFDGLRTNTGLTLFFQGSKNADVLEILYWI